MGNVKNACNTLVRKPEEKKPFGRSRHIGRIVLNLYIDVTVLGIHLAQVNIQWRYSVKSIIHSFLFNKRIGMY
jgi:hypothetical protein